MFRSVTFRLFKNFWSMRKQWGNKLTMKKLLFSFVSLSPQIKKKKKNIKTLLGVPKVKEYEKYLGLLAVVSRNRRASLNYIKEMMWGKL